jgi:hypothetical protein
VQVGCQSVLLRCVPPARQGARTLATAALGFSAHRRSCAHACTPDARRPPITVGCSRRCRQRCAALSSPDGALACPARTCRRTWAESLLYAC